MTKANPPDFVCVPINLIRRRESGLSNSALRLFELMKYYAGSKRELWYSQARLATDLCLSTRRIRDLINELHQARLIEVRRRGLNQTNYYYILDQPDNQATPENQADELPDRKFSATLDRKNPAALDRKNPADELDSIELDSKNVCDSPPTQNQNSEEQPGAKPEQKTIAEQIIKLGIGPHVAHDLIQQAATNGHNENWLQAWIEAAQRPSITEPAAYFRAMVLENNKPPKPKKAKPKETLADREARELKNKMQKWAKLAGVQL